MIDDPLVTNILFYPRKTPKPITSPKNINVLELQINQQIIIGGLYYIKNANLPTILLFHGNGEIAEDYRYFYNLFHDCDLNLAVIDYRGYGFSSGKPNYSSLIQDAIPIYNKFYEWTIQHNFITKIIVMGRSLGSICAAEIGSNQPSTLQGIIFESGFASLYNMMIRLFGSIGRKITKNELYQFSNDTKMANIRSPVMVIHGTKDEIIPFSEGELIFKALKKAKNPLFVPINGAGHNDIFTFRNEYQKALKNFLLEI